jgi:8-oxo-dGTP diphosphatase
MPDTTVAAIVTTVDSGTTKVLLTRRNIEPFKWRWSLPGGHIDQYESVRDAVIREVKEETGLDFDAHFFGYFDEIIPERDIHAVVMVFEGPGAGALTPSEHEVADAEWFSVESAQCLPLAFTHNEILSAYSLEHLRRGTSCEGQI